MIKDQYDEETVNKAKQFARVITDSSHYQTDQGRRWDGINEEDVLSFCYLAFGPPSKEKTKEQIKVDWADLSSHFQKALGFAYTEAPKARRRPCVWVMRDGHIWGSVDEAQAPKDAAVVIAFDIGLPEKAPEETIGSRDNPSPFDGAIKAENDEPRFVLIGRDPDAPGLIRFWADAREAREEDLEQVAEARKIADAMDEWRRLTLLRRSGEEESDVHAEGNKQEAQE